MVDALPFLKQLVVQLAGQEPVHDHRICDVAEQAQVCVGPLGLLDDHLLQVEHDADGGDLGIRQHLAHAIQVHEQVLERGVDLIRGKRHGHHRLQHGACHPHRAPGPGIDLVEPPLRRVGKGEQLQRLASRSAVDDEDVVLGALRVVLDPHERSDFVHAGRVGDLVGQDLIETLRREDLDRVLVELRPVPLHLVQG